MGPRGREWESSGRIEGEGKKCGCFQVFGQDLGLLAQCFPHWPGCALVIPEGPGHSSLPCLAISLVVAVFEQGKPLQSCFTGTHPVGNFVLPLDDLPALPVPTAPSSL